MDNTANTLNDISTVFNDTMKLIEEKSETKWNALSKEDQLDYFCAVVRRIYKAEIEEGRSYRGALYTTFGFGPEAYAQAQMAGYLAIHNYIITPEEERRTLEEFAKFAGVDKPNDAIYEFFKQGEGI